FDAADDVVPVVLIEILPGLGDDLVQVHENGCARHAAQRGGLFVGIQRGHGILICGESFGGTSMMRGGARARPPARRPVRHAGFGWRRDLGFDSKERSACGRAAPRLLVSRRRHPSNRWSTTWYP